MVRWYVIAILLFMPAVARAQYTVVELSAFAVPTDINNRLQVVGFSTMTNDAMLWDVAGVRVLGVRVAPYTGLFINDLTQVVGIRVVDGQRRPFAWINGIVYDVPTPPGDTIQAISALTNSGIVVMQGATSWAWYDGQLYDLTGLTGARIYAANDAGVLGGLLGIRPYVRMPDGNVVTPWDDATPVQVVGSQGHLAGSLSGPVEAPWHYGQLGARFVTVPPLSPVGVALHLNALNAAGDLVGGELVHGARFYAFLYRNGLAVDLTSAISNSALHLLTATGINDAGFITAMASESGPTFPMYEPGAPARAVVLVPMSPAAPTGVHFALAKRAVWVGWEPVVGALDYIIEAGSTPGASDLLVAPVGPESFFATTAPPGRYFVRVRARNVMGVSAPSEEVVITVA